MEKIVSDSYDGKTRTLFKVSCVICSSSNYLPAHVLKNRKEYFCSSACKKESRSIKVHCAWCDSELLRTPSSFARSKSGLVFCGRKCKEKAQKIGGLEAIQPDHYGAGIGKTDYRLTIEESGIPRKCCKCSYDKVPEILQVHHKDRNRTNNDLSNLELVCPNCHNEEHFLTQSGVYSKKMSATLV